MRRIHRNATGGSVCGRIWKEAALRACFSVNHDAGSVHLACKLWWRLFSFRFGIQHFSFRLAQIAEPSKHVAIPVRSTFLFFALFFGGEIPNTSFVYSTLATHSVAATRRCFGRRETAQCDIHYPVFRIPSGGIPFSFPKPTRE